jgi:hypothetical protein
MQEADESDLLYHLEDTVASLGDTGLELVNIPNATRLFVGRYIGMFDGSDDDKSVDPQSVLAGIASALKALNLDTNVQLHFVGCEL